MDLGCYFRGPPGLKSEERKKKLLEKIQEGEKQLKELEIFVKEWEAFRSKIRWIKK